MAKSCKPGDEQCAYPAECSSLAANFSGFFCIARYAEDIRGREDKRSVLEGLLESYMGHPWLDPERPYEVRFVTPEEKPIIIERVLNYYK